MKPPPHAYSEASVVGFEELERLMTERGFESKVSWATEGARKHPKMIVALSDTMKGKIQQTDAKHLFVDFVPGLVSLKMEDDSLYEAIVFSVQDNEKTAIVGLALVIHTSTAHLFEACKSFLSISGGAFDAFTTADRNGAT